MTDDTFRFCQTDDYPDPGSDPDPEIPSSRPDSATPEEGQLGTVTLDELFYLLTDGALGVEPKRAPTSLSSSSSTSSTTPTDDTQDCPQSVNARE